MVYLISILIGVANWSPGELEITFIDVGLGNSVLIITPDGKVALYDGGATNAGDRKVGWYIKNRNIKTINWMFYADPDADHTTGLNELLDGQLDNLTHNDTPFGTGVYNIICTSNTINKTASTTSTKLIYTAFTPILFYTNGDFSMYIVHAGTPSSPPPGYSEDNASDIVIGIKYKDFRFLLTADKNAIYNIIQNMNQIGLFPLTGMQIPHHGGSSQFHDWNSDLVFTSTQQPKFAVASTAYGGAGPLNEEFINRYKRKGIKVYRTDLHGDVTIKTNGVSYTISVTKQPLNEIEIEERKIPIHAYPNPASDKITFVYELKAIAEDVKIEVYNLLGDKLKTLDGTKNIGKNYIEWEIDDSIGDGVYYAVALVKSGGDVKVGRYRFAILR